MLPPGISCRPQTDADRAFLAQLYAGTRSAEMELVAWTPDQKAAFLAMQFDAQWSHYQRHFPDAAFLVIEQDGQPVGRIYIHRAAEHIGLIDIALLPEARGRGLGTRLIGDILDEAAATGKSVKIHVERFNPALRLYQRLGFLPIAEDAIYVQMRWSAPATGVS